MGWNNRASSYVSAASFISFIQPKFYLPDNEMTYNGYVDLVLTCCTDIHVGSGASYMPENSNQFVRQTMMYDGKPVIPGSSLKGAVRSIASAASNGCLPKLPFVKNGNAPKYPDGIKNILCTPQKQCIVCDIFGTIGKSSKVIFSDMFSENAKTEVKRLNSQYSPKSAYTESDGTLKGYKFYLTGDNYYDIPAKVNVQVIKQGAVFKGRVHFKKLTEEEISLLMFSLGVNENEEQDIVLKLGGFRNEGIGEVRLRAAGYVCEGIKKSPSDLASQYYDMDTANKKGIKKLCNEILVPQ